MYTLLRCIYLTGSQTERADIRGGVLYNDEEYNVIHSTYVAIQNCRAGLSGREISLSLYSYGVCIGQVEDRKFLRKLSLQCLVLDEGHMLKNMASQRYTHLMKIKVRICQCILPRTCRRRRGHVTKHLAKFQNWAINSKNLSMVQAAVVTIISYKSLSGLKFASTCACTQNTTEVCKLVEGLLKS